jgi:hypothetical protein
VRERERYIYIYIYIVTRPIHLHAVPVGIRQRATCSFSCSGGHPSIPESRHIACSFQTCVGWQSIWLTTFPLPSSTCVPRSHICTCHPRHTSHHSQALLLQLPARKRTGVGTRACVTTRSLCDRLRPPVQFLWRCRCLVHSTLLWASSFSLFIEHVPIQMLFDLRSKPCILFNVDFECHRLCSRVILV